MQKVAKEHGTCFIDSADFVINNPHINCKYCEAVVINSIDNKPMRHAFVELEDGIIYDAAAKVTLPKEKYYNLGQLKHVYKANRDRLIDLVYHNGHYGSFFIQDLCSR